MKKLSLVIFLLLTCSHYPVQAQAPYHQGKTVTLIVGTLAADLYDLYARAIALRTGRFNLRGDQCESLFRATYRAFRG